MINNRIKISIISAFVLNYNCCPAFGKMPFIWNWNESDDKTWNDGALVLGGWVKVEDFIKSIDKLL